MLSHKVRWTAWQGGSSTWLVEIYDCKGENVGESLIAVVEAEYENPDGGLDDIDPPANNNDFGLEPPPATPNAHVNYDIVVDNNNGTHNDNDIIMENWDDPYNDNIHEYENDDPQLYPQLDTTNEQPHLAPIPEPTVEAGDICCSSFVCTKSKQLIPSIDSRKSYGSTANTTIIEQDFVDIVGPNNHL